MGYSRRWGQGKIVGRWLIHIIVFGSCPKRSPTSGLILTDVKRLSNSCPCRSIGCERNTARANPVNGFYELIIQLRPRSTTILRTTEPCPTASRSVLDCGDQKVWVCWMCGNSGSVAGAVNLRSDSPRSDHGRH